MNILTVIPLSRAKGLDTLSYFTGQDIPVGAIVTVPVRSKPIHAIVIGTRQAEDLKAEIKTAPYEIKKLSRVRATAFFPAAFMDACATLADYYATSTGAVVDTLIADSLLEQAGKIAAPLPRQASISWESSKPEATTGKWGETRAVQGDDDDRMSSWRSLIRQEFAKKKSLAIYVPTIEDARTICAALEKGIEGYIFMLNASLPKKKLTETWTSIAEMEHPLVVIATGSFSVLPRGDIDTVIIERENSRGWISQKSPYLDVRHAIETVARAQRQSVYLADSLLRTETLHRLDNHEIFEGTPFKWRSISDARDALIDMRAKNPKIAAAAQADAEPQFRVLSKELEELIQVNRDSNTHLFILTLRRGNSPITVCGDCQSLVTCVQCSAPVVLHTSKENGRNFFMCHSCGARRSAEEVCKVCDSWKLIPLGIGIDKVREEILARFPGTDIFQMDADTTKTEKQIAEVLEKFKARPGSILLGTEMALPHIVGRTDHVAVASLDSLFALPDFRIQEKIMYLLVRLRAAATRSFVVQTRRPEESVFDYGIKGNLSDFHRATLGERKEFNYPPFSLLIKITLEGKKEKIAQGMAAIQKQLFPLEIDIFPAFTATVRGNSVIHGLIKLDSRRWPDPELRAKLRALPPHAMVKINPESLL